MQPRSTPRLAIGTLAALLAGKLLLHAAAMRQYGYFRDELYYLASTEHLDWGYVDHPPLSIAILAWVRSELGDSLPALRIVPALAGAAIVLLAGLMARQLGGGRFAQGLAALCVVMAPVFLGTAHYYSMNVYDQLFWAVAVFTLLRALDEGRRRHWLLLGLVLGVGFLNKISILWLGAGIVVGLALTGYRRLLRQSWPQIGALAAVAVCLPYIVWQARHGWPTLEFMHNATALKMADTPPLRFLLDQVLSMNPASAPVWVAGLFFGLFGGERARGRVLAWIYLTVFTLLIAAGHSRASYLAPAYPPLLALGAVAIEGLTARPRLGWLRPSLAAAVIALGLVALPMALPILPVETFVRYQAALGLTPHTDERQQMGALPQHYADMFGWQEMAELVAEAYHRLPTEEREHCRVFAQNYGEAGAIDVLGRKLGLPRALSGHNSYWLWGLDDTDPPTVLIIIGGDREDNAKYFEEIEIVGQTASRWAMPYERGLDVSIARRPKVNLREAWPSLKQYI